VTVIYPPQQQATPVMIQVGPDGEYTTVVQRQPATIYEAPWRRETAEEPEPPADSARYLLAFKDHTIYSAVAYWADGDTLHYFTTGNTHNQASLSLIDRELTERLNRELGIDFKLPATK
jgi:endonuclease YncB( thermonuclease family)